MDSLPAPEWLTKDYLNNFVNDSIDDSTSLVDYEIVRGSNVGDNYICDVFRIKLTLNKNGKSSHLSVIGKYNRETEMNLELIKEGIDVHHTESKFLKQTLPVLNKYCPNQKIGPICYYSDDEHRMIFMEDLKPLGFEMVPRNIFLDIDHCFKAIQAIAVLHAISYLELQKNPQLGQQYEKNLWKKEIDEKGRVFVDSVVDGIKNKMDEWGFTLKHKEILKKYRQKALTNGNEVCQFDPNFFNVLTHRDCWKNNILYKYKNNQVEDICLLDYQLVNYNCFALDLQYFLSSSAQKEIRYEKENEILEFYYDEFTKIAPDASELTLERVKSEFKKKDLFGLFTTVILRAIVVSDKGIDFNEIANGRSDGGLGKNNDFGEELKCAFEFYEHCL